MHLSVVIPAYNEARSIQPCLRSLAAQQTRYPFEVVVVDNNSTDQTAEAARAFPFVRVVHEPRQGIALARQAGEDAASGEVVLHTDADSELPADWVDRVGREFEQDENLVLLSGPIAYPSGPLLARGLQILLNWAALVWWALTRRLAVVNGCNFAVRKSALDRAGGFPCALPEIGDSRVLGMLRRQGRVALLRGRPVRTSPRRVEAQGVLYVYGFYLLEQIASVLSISMDGFMRRQAVRLTDNSWPRRRPRRALLALPMLPALLAAAGCAYLAINPNSQVYGRIYLHGSRADKTVALTFDDGPNEPYTSEVLDILDHYGVKATFFEIAQNVEFYPQSTERLVADGQVIGNHSYDHSRIATAVDFRYRELDQAQGVFEAIAGVAPTLFRPPAGIHTPWQLRTIKGERLVAVNWDSEGLDWQNNATSESITKNVLKNVQPGSIILLHDGDELRHGSDRSQTVKALPEIIEGLQARGYRFVTVPQMLGVPSYQPLDDSLEAPPGP
jgi:peptidoglycan-N-acetylglucosamine deacetylase